MNSVLEFGHVRSFAIHWHGDQKRKYTGEPYWHHLAAVAELVSKVTQNPTIIKAAWLHDVVEDTDCTIGLVQQEFGTAVGEIVDQLTDRYTHELFPYMNRRERKAWETNRLAIISPEAMTVKLADLIDNTKSIKQHDPDFAKVYLREKRELLKVLIHGSALLYGMALDQVA